MCAYVKGRAYGVCVCVYMVRMNFVKCMSVHACVCSYT